MENLLMGALLVGVGVLVVGLLLRRRSAGQSTAEPTLIGNSLRTVQTPSPDAPPELPADPEVLAVLEVMDGPPALLHGQVVGPRVDVRSHRLTIGRNPRQVDLQFYNLEVQSSVSRLHCTLEFNEKLRCFFITDEQSSSGTRLNGNPIAAHSAQALSTGDLIEIGMSDAAGVVLRFFSVYSAPVRGLRVEPQQVPKDTLRQAIPETPGKSTARFKTDVFISYNREDKAAMTRVRDHLLQAGLQVWVDDKLQPGSPNWQHDVERAIQHTRCVVALFSPSAKASAWVSEELTYARNQKRPILPVLIRGDESTAVPFGFGNMQWIDMRADYADPMDEVVIERALEQLLAAIMEQRGL